MWCGYMCVVCVCGVVCMCTWCGGAVPMSVACLWSGMNGGLGGGVGVIV